MKFKNSFPKDLLGPFAPVLYWIGLLGIVFLIACFGFCVYDWIMTKRGF
jgi:hypothetical protein